MRRRRGERRRNKNGLVRVSGRSGGRREGKGWKDRTGGREEEEGGGDKKMMKRIGGRGRSRREIFGGKNDGRNCKA